MWSLGVILYVLLTGTPPFDADGGSRSSASIDFPDDVPAAARDLILQLLQQDPRQRATAVTACEHAWILQADGDTHVHPLDDPKLLSLQTDAVAPLLLSHNHIDGSNNNSDFERLEQQLLPSASNDDDAAGTTTTVEDGDQPTDDAPIAESACAALDDEVKVAPETSRSNVDVSVGNAPAPPTCDALDAVKPAEQSLKSTGKSKVRVSASNFSFLKHSPVARMINNDDEDKSPLEIAKDPRMPLSPVSSNDRDAVDMKTKMASTTPKAVVFEPSWLKDFGSATKVSALDDEAKKLMGYAANAITPAASNLRPSEPAFLDQVARIEVALQTDREQTDDELLSNFTDNTESISSFSTAIVEVDENVELCGKQETEDEAKVGSRRKGPSKSNQKKTAASGLKSAGVSTALAKVAPAAKPDRESRTSAKTVSAKREGPTIKTNSAKKPKARATRPSSDAKTTKKTAGGKQTTLNNWFKKHN